MLPCTEQEKEVEARETVLELTRQGSARESAKLLAVWRSVNSVRQDFNSTNTATSKDLDRLKADLNEWSSEFLALYYLIKSALRNEDYQNI